LITSYYRLAFRWHCAEAIAAIDRTNATRLKRNLGVFAALGADYREHLPSLAIATAATVTVAATEGVSLARGTTFGATLWLISVATGCELFLLLNRKHEVCTAIGTGKGFGFKTHR